MVRNTKIKNSFDPGLNRMLQNINSTSRKENQVMAGTVDTVENTRNRLPRRKMKKESITLSAQ